MASLSKPQVSAESAKELYCREFIQNFLANLYGKTLKFIVFYMDGIFQGKRGGDFDDRLGIIWCLKYLPVNLHFLVYVVTTKDRYADTVKDYGGYDIGGVYHTEDPEQYKLLRPLLANSNTTIVITGPIVDPEFVKIVMQNKYNIYTQGGLDGYNATASPDGCKEPFDGICAVSTNVRVIMDMSFFPEEIQLWANQVEESKTLFPPPAEAPFTPGLLVEKRQTMFLICLNIVGKTLGLELPQTVREAYDVLVKNGHVTQLNKDESGFVTSTACDRMVYNYVSKMVFNKDYTVEQKKNLFTESLMAMQIVILSIALRKVKINPADPDYCSTEWCDVNEESGFPTMAQVDIFKLTVPLKPHLMGYDIITMFLALCNLPVLPFIKMYTEAGFGPNNPIPIGTTTEFMVNQIEERTGVKRALVADASDASATVSMRNGHRE